MRFLITSRRLNETFKFPTRNKALLRFNVLSRGKWRNLREYLVNKRFLQRQKGASHAMPIGSPIGAFKRY